MSIKSITLLHRMIVGTATAVLAAVLSLSANATPLYNFTSFDGPGNNGGGTTVNGINNFGDVWGFRPIMLPPRRYSPISSATLMAHSIR
jgi:hypothetical protein